MQLLEASEVPKGTTGVYKGKKYRIEYLGKTKYGRRAKLQFLSGTREFWVDADLVEVPPEPSNWGRSKGNPCAECGGSMRGKGIEARDSSGLVARVCPKCAKEPWYTRSFG